MRNSFQCWFLRSILVLAFVCRMKCVQAPLSVRRFQFESVFAADGKTIDNNQHTICFVTTGERALVSYRPSIGAHYYVAGASELDYTLR